MPKNSDTTPEKAKEQPQQYQQRDYHNKPALPANPDKSVERSDWSGSSWGGQSWSGRSQSGGRDR